MNELANVDTSYHSPVLIRVHKNYANEDGSASEYDGRGGARMKVGKNYLRG